jgi:hypothetical protein
MKKIRINEVLIVQANHTPGDSVDLGSKCIGVTIRCLQDSPQNGYIGWNEPASPKNLLEPGDNVSYNVGDVQDAVLDGNLLYVGFAGANARLIVSIMNIVEEC